MVDRYGHVCNGKGPRMQVSFNFSISTSNLLKGCSIVCDTIKGILVQTENDYKSKVTSLAGIQGIGDLGAQHILAIASLCSVIPPYFCSTAQLCAGTHTAKGLAENYNINPSVAKKLYAEIALELGVTVAYVENITCEYPRENDPAKPYDPVEHLQGILNRTLRDGSFKAPDTYFGDQDLFKVSVDSSGILGIVCLQGKGNHVLMTQIDLPDIAASVLWSIPSNEFDLEIKTSHKSRLPGAPLSRRQPRKPKRIKHSGIGVSHGIEKAVQERYLCRLNDANEDSRQAGNEAYSAHLSRAHRIDLAVSRSSRTRNSPKLQMNVLMSATRENKTYCYIDWSTVLLSLHTQTGLPPSKKEKRNRGRRKNIFSFIRWYELCHEGYTLFTCEFNHHKQTILSSSNSLLLKTGFVMHGDKRAWYTSKFDAQRALIVNILTHVATQRQTTGDPEWACSKLRTDMKGLAENDFCVLYDCGGGDRNDTIFGVLFFRGDDRVFSVPNTTSDYTGGWSNFCFRSIRSKLLV
jgi:hypothetical protein